MTIPDLAVWAVEVTERREETMTKIDADARAAADPLGMLPGVEEEEDLTAAQTALRQAESHVQQRRQELQAAVLQARETRSLADIARELGVSKQRVQQISKGK